MRLIVRGEVIKTYEIETEPAPDAEVECLRFRLELVKHMEPDGQTEAILYRKEFFRIQPTFPQQDGKPAHEPCDEFILVEETHLLDRCRFPASDSPSAILSDVLKQLNTRLYSSG